LVDFGISGGSYSTGATETSHFLMPEFRKASGILHYHQDGTVLLGKRVINPKIENISTLSDWLGNRPGHNSLTA